MAGNCMATPESESFVRTFARGLKIIEAMGQGAARQTLGDVAEAVDLPRTAVRRFLLTLIDLSFVKTDGKYYWLTPKVLRSEEHTSELQSLMRISYAVFCLKKKN